MKSLFVLSCLICSAFSLSCYNCQANSNGITPTSPVFNPKYFKSTLNSDCNLGTDNTTKPDCESFCILQYIYKTGIGSIIVRACANDLLVGTIVMPKSGFCLGKLFPYDTISMDGLSGYGYACDSDNCNNMPGVTLSLIPHNQNCTPCADLYCPNQGQCTSVDGYSGQCDCNEQNGNFVCNSNTPLPTTTSYTSSTTSTISSTTKNISTTGSDVPLLTTNTTSNTSTFTTTTATHNLKTNAKEWLSQEVIATLALVGLSLLFLGAGITFFWQGKKLHKKSKSMTSLFNSSSSGSALEGLQRRLDCIESTFPHSNSFASDNMSIASFSASSCWETLDTNSEAPPPPRHASVNHLPPSTKTLPAKLSSSHTSYNKTNPNGLPRKINHQAKPKPFDSEYCDVERIPPSSSNFSQAPIPPKIGTIPRRPMPNEPIDYENRESGEYDEIKEDRDDLYDDVHPM